MTNRIRLAASLDDGPHSLLAALCGEFEGEARTWFQPEELADTSTWKGSITPILGGRFVVLSYEGRLKDDKIAGQMTIGYHFDRERWEAAWADRFHTGSSLMYFTGDDAEKIAFYGTYPAGEGPDWGWRTLFETPDADTVRMTMWNVMPHGSESKAVEVRFKRVRGEG